MKTFLFSLLFFAYIDASASPNPAPTDSIRSASPLVQVTGELMLSTGFYKLSGLASSSQLMPFGLDGYLTLTSRSGWTIPARLTWTSQSYRYRQPCNQIGISPRYKDWLTLHAGYRTVVFSPLTLAGHTFLGAGVELNPGLFRVGFVTGKFNRAVDVNYADPERVASFRRTGYSAKIGLGNARNYLDLILLNVTDDASSVRSDSLGHLSPAENLVLGVSGRVQINRKLLIEVDAAGSAYTSDARTDTLSPSSASDRRFDYLRRINRVRKLFTARQSTTISTAVQASFGYRASWGDLKLRYKRIEPGYKSMGAYYFQHDIENITVAPALRLVNKRLQVRSSIGWQHDNLANQKKARTDRLIGSLSMSYTTKKDLMIDLSFSNYGTTQRAGFRPLNDTARVAQNNRTLSGSLFKIWTGQSAMHTLNGSATYQVLQDLNPFTADQNQNQNWNYTVNYALQHLVTGLDLNVGYSYTNTQLMGMSSMFHGPSLSLGQKLLKQKQLTVVLGGSYLQSREMLDDLGQTGFVLTSSLNIDYQITPAHRFSIFVTNLLNKGAAIYREQQGTVQYTMSF